MMVTGCGDDQHRRPAERLGRRGGGAAWPGAGLGLADPDAPMPNCSIFEMSHDHRTPTAHAAGRPDALSEAVSGRSWRKFPLTNR